MDGFKRVTTSITEDVEQLSGASEDAMLRMAGLTESVGIPTVGTVSANDMVEQGPVKSPTDGKNVEGEAEKDPKDEPTADKPSSEESKKGKKTEAEGDEPEDEDEPEDDDEEDDEEEYDESVHHNESYWRGALGENFEWLMTEAKKVKGKGKKKKMSALVKELAKRGDVRDPEALAGWLAWNDPNRSESVEEIDGPIVTEAMLRRFAALPFDVMEDDDFDAVIEDLKGKKMPDDASEDLLKLAEDTAVALLEAARKKKRVRKALQKGAKKTIMKCSDPDKHWDPKKKACVAKTGKYIVKRRVKTREAGRGIQATHSKQRERKKKAKGIVSADETFANRLGSLLRESNGKALAESTIRDEILERIDRIFALIDEEFCDEAVSDVLLRVMEDLDEKSEAGVLSEDAMSEDEFTAALAPALKIIRECFDKINEQDDEPEDDDDDEDESEDEPEDDKSEKDEDLLGNLRAL